MKLFSLILGIIPLVVMSQPSNLEIGISGGTTIYVGDLSGSLAQYSTADLGYTGGIFLRKNLNQHLGIRFTLQYSNIKADELNRRVPNPRALNFNNQLKQATILGEWRIFNLSFDDEKLVIAPFLAGGGTFQLSEPQFRDVTYGNVPLRMLGTEGQGIPGYPDFYKPYVFSLPAGAGLSVSIKRRLTLTAEIVGHRVFGDYIDDVSSAPVKMNDLLANPRGSSLALNAFISNPILYPTPSNTPYSRGGPAVDWFYLVQMTMSYHIGGNPGKSFGKKGGVPCPTFW
jgi:hypothetical protein